MAFSKLQGKYSIETFIILNKTREEAWEVLKDFGNVYTWAPGVTESHLIGTVDSGVGMGRHCEIEGFGGIDEYVQEYEEGKGFMYDVSSLGPIDKFWSIWELDELDGARCRVKVTTSYNLRWGIFGRLMHKFVMRKRLEAALPGTLKSFKTRVDSGELYRPLKEIPVAA